MHRLFYLIIFLIISLRVYNQETVQDSIIRIKITDQADFPLYGLTIQNNNSNYIHSFTDENGEGYINLKTVSNDTHIKISGIGYKAIILSLSELIKHPNIQLEEVRYDLPMIDIVHPTLEAILKKSQEQITPPAKLKFSQPAYYGNGSYTKVVESQNRVIHFRREYGFFLTPGNCIMSKNIWFPFYFFPIVSARSVDLLCNGQDTLKKKVEYEMGRNENLAYDAVRRKIFESMEIVYRYTPLFAPLGYFTFRWGEETPEHYCILFSTHTGIPSHISTYKGQCKGTLYINKTDYRLQKICIDHFIRQFIISAPSAFKKIQVDFAYTQNNICYIEECHLETIWRAPASLKNKVTISELSARPFAAKNQLVEKETWKCENYKMLNKKIQDREMTRKISFLSNFVQAPYDSLMISSIFDTPECNLDILDNYMPLEKQYKLNSMKLYWSEFDEDGKRYFTYIQLKDFMNQLREKYYISTNK